eukprot:2789874-Pyramimonas_sp.AAC.1
MKWSAAGFGNNATDVVVAMSNSMELVQLGVYGMVSTFHKQVSMPMHRVLDCAAGRPGRIPTVATHLKNKETPKLPGGSGTASKDETTVAAASAQAEDSQAEGSHAAASAEAGDRKPTAINIIEAVAN